MISPGRSWEVPVRSWDVLGVHVMSCEYMFKSWEVLGGPWRFWEVFGVLESPGRFLGAPGKSWELMGGHESI